MLKEILLVLFYILLSVTLLKAFTEAGNALATQSTLAASEFTEFESCYGFKAIQSAGGNAAYPNLTESCSYG